MELMQIVSSLVSVEKITARKLEDTSVILKILEIKAQKIKNFKKKSCSNIYQFYELRRRDYFLNQGAKPVSPECHAKFYLEEIIISHGSQLLTIK